MSYLKMNIKQMKDAQDYQQSILKELKTLTNSVDEVCGRLNNSSMYDIKIALKKTIENMKSSCMSMNELNDALYDIIHLYEKAEQQIANHGGNSNVIKKCIIEIKERLNKIGNNMIGKQESCTYDGDPVNMCNGDFIIEKEDICLQGIFPLAFKRFYNALGVEGGSMGQGWSHSLDYRLIVEHQEIDIISGDGKVEKFKTEDSQTYYSIYGSHALLTRVEMGYIYTDDQGIRKYFDEKGNFFKSCNRNGNGFTYYDTQAGGKRADIYFTNGHAEIESTGNYFELQFHQNGRLEAISDHMGRTVLYTYETDKLVSVTLADKSEERYTYDNEGRLQDSINPMGTTIVSNVYDEGNRVIQQTYPDGAKMQYHYDDARKAVELVQQNGNRIIYLHDDKFRHIATEYYDGEETFEYNEFNKVIKRKDKNGNITQYNYDNRGNITCVIDALGNKKSITYDALNKPEQYKGPMGESISNKHDSRGNLIEMADSLGNKTEMTYDQKGSVSTVRQPDGSIVKLSYDSCGNITGITDELNHTIEYTYDELNRVIRTKDGRGLESFYQYDEADRIICVRNALKQERIYTYTASGRVLEIQDFDGYKETWEYNQLDLPCSYTDKNGSITIQQYDKMWNVSQVILPNGGIITNCYNSLNRLTEHTDVEGLKTIYTYDPNGNRLTETLGGLTKSYQYDAMDRRNKYIDTVGNTTRMEYDKNGKLTCLIKADGTEIKYIYDKMGNCIEKTDELGQKIGYTYTKLGKIKAITDKSGKVTEYSYYPGGMLKKVDYPDHTWVKFDYDENRNLRSRTLQSGYSIYYKYDELDRVIEIVDSDLKCKRYEYDTSGNVVCMTDARDNSTNYEYSPNGNLVYVKDALGHETRYSYDRMNRLSVILKGNCSQEVIDAAFGEEWKTANLQNRENKELHITRYERNLNGQITRISDAIGVTEEYEYNTMGQVVSHKDADDYVTSYTYQANGEVESISYSDGKSVKMSYDPLKRLTQIEDWLGTTQIEYDKLGRTIEVTNPEGQKTGYEWGADNQKTALIYPDGSRLCYEYDSARRLTGLVENNHRVTYAYDENSRIAEKYLPGSVKTTYLYNQNGQLNSLVHEDKNGILDRYRYQYDNNGNRVRIERYRRGLSDECGCFNYLYDALNRLTEVQKDTNTVRQYAYDEYSNRINKQEADGGMKYEYNVLNQLTRLEEIKENSIRVSEFMYDKRGNMISMEKDDEAKRYCYGPMNRLQQVVRANGSRTNYIYDGLGRRVGVQKPETDLGNETIGYILDFTKNYNNLLARYQCESKENYYWDSHIVGSSSDSNLHVYLLDELGSTIRYLDRDGDQVDCYAYDEFGQDLYGNQGRTQPFGYTGYCYDAEAGTYYAQAREYDPQVGRFVEKDKDEYIHLRLPETVNLYQYCVNNAVLFVDPSGNDCYIFYLPEWKNEAINDRKQLQKKYDLKESEVHLVPITNNQELTDAWNAMGIENGNTVDIDAVVINTHASGKNERLSYGDNSEDKFTATEIQALDNKDVGTLVLYGCNAGHLDHVSSNPAAEFSKKVNGAPVVASDGTVVSCLTFFNQTKRNYKSVADSGFTKALTNGTRKNEGWIVYKYEDGNVKISDSQGKKLNLTELLKVAKKAECECPLSK